MSERKFTITTIDNPFNPIDEFKAWFSYDIEMGYNTLSKLARLTNVEPYMTQKEENEEIERAIERLIELDPFELYTKCYYKK